MDFVRGFIGRHQELSVRRGNLIKRSRAALSHADVNEFFDNYEKTAAGIPPENIFNCDETNLQAGVYIYLYVAESVLPEVCVRGGSDRGYGIGNGKVFRPKSRPLPFL
jgi:hypothetical protein